MTRCDAYWDKVRKLLSQGDKEALVEFCEKSPDMIRKIIDYVEYSDKYLNDTMVSNKDLFNERTTRPLRTLERIDPELHDTVLAEVIQLDKPTAKEVKRIIQEKKIELFPEQETDERIVLDSIENTENYLKPNSVDLILTDPPYIGECTPLWSALAEKAAVILKPGGFLVCYSGQFHLPEIFRRLTEHLEYIWTFALIHKGAKTSIDARHIFNGWKPILVFAKPPFELSWMPDIIDGAGREKQDHEWQQALQESEQLIERFTHEGQLVVDPFLGSGTTVLAAKKLNRNFFGMDNDELAIKTTLRRLQHEE